MGEFLKENRFVIFGAMLVCLSSAVCVTNPVLGISLAALPFLVAVTFHHPHKTACVLGFLTAAFPKAGVKIGDFPFPVFLFGLFVAVLLIRVHQPRSRHTTTTVLALLAFLTWVFVRALQFLPSGTSSVAAFVAWAGVPLVMFAVSTTVAGDAVKFRRAIEWGFLVAVAYAVVQFFGGLESTAIPGLTHAFGDTITNKHNVIYSDNGDDFSKIPSTYQNGNIFGIVAAVFFTLAMMRIMAKKASHLDVLVLCGAAIAITLSGSRTAIVAAGIAGVILLLRGGHLGRKVAVLMAVGAAVVVVIGLQPGLFARYSVNDIASTGGAGRSTMWDLAESQMSELEFAFGTSTYRLTEGWLGIVMQIGILGIALLCVAVVLVARKRPAMKLPLLVLVAGAIIDSTYQVFPTWFLVAALAAAEPYGGSKREEAGVHMPTRTLTPSRRALVPDP
ncbi:hypothetical protein [Arthrobacter sp. H14-L1]|uniref:hypothetical protein n=1 Tax=Arthrobacter sp. H14-L1 TaxID=2996697 RepID=UPI00226E9710|nr:hypothetical protein [Arthrobacter sp. H14-L1]MCY0905465.1 hypothetical protein [Arthrobacter sp. H14-L1]